MTPPVAERTALRRPSCRLLTAAAVLLGLLSSMEITFGQTVARLRPAVPLIRNGGFETDTAWSLSQYSEIVTGSARTGRRCLKAFGDRGASAEQTVWSVGADRTYTASGWIRTEGVPSDPQGYAFLAVYEYDRGGRLVRFQDYARITGDTPWTRYHCTVRLTAATDYLTLRAGLHAASGTAWFDDLNLTAGGEPAPWQEPAPQADRTRTYRAAIFHEPGLPVDGYATPVATLRKGLAAEGIPASLLTAADLAAGKLNPDAFDLLIVPTGASFPIAARRGLLGFLMAGGDLLCTGGYAFDNLLARDDGGWISYRERLKEARTTAAGRQIPNGGFEDATGTGWEADGPACAIDDETAVSGKRSGRVRIDDLGSGARWTATLEVEPGKTYLVGAHARATNIRGSHFGFLAVYQYDGDNKLLEFKDFAHLTGSSDWRRYETPVAIHPAARRVLFHAGLYLAAGTLNVDDVTLGALPSEERINAHYGTPMDGLVVSPVQLTLFSPDQPLTGVRAVGAWPGMEGVRIEGDLRGFDATAQLRESGRWQSILTAQDRYGRISGSAGALVTHTTGPFGGSRWALFGITNRDIFAGPAGLTLLRRTLRVLAQPVAARSLTSDYALYEPGETALLTLGLHAPSRTARAAPITITLTLDAPGRSSKPIVRFTKRLTPASAMPARLSFSWKTPPSAPDFVRARAVLALPSGEVMDTIETGFCVRSGAVIAAGTRIRFSDNAFELHRPGTPPTRTTLFGTDTYANMFLSPSCSPLTWYRDLQAMRAYGLHMYENLQYPPAGWTYSKAEWRRMDALIQLSQRFGLPYMAGLLIGVNVAVDDATLEAQARMCRTFAARYRHVPGLIYYLNGDFKLDLADLPDLRRLWNEMLRERYGTDEALRAAWGGEAAPERLGEIPVQNHRSDAPFSVRRQDVRRFQAALVRRWVGALTAAIRSEDTEHPITSEFYQRPYDGIDLRLSMDGMDVANIGYFGPPQEDLAQLLATIKWNDRRRDSKSVNIGEFGVKTHDAWKQEGNAEGYHVGRSEEEQRRQLWWIVHAALAFDVTKIQNWCWSDDPDRVFPWGVAYVNPLRPKPALKLWRNLRLLSELMPHAYEPARTVFVMPDSWRLGAPDAASWRWVANALEWLLATNLRFDVVNEADVGNLHPIPRLVIAPLTSRAPQRVLDQLGELARSGATVYLSDPPDALLHGPEPVRQGYHDLLVRELGTGRLILCPGAPEAMPEADLFVQQPELASDPEVNRYLALPGLAGMEPEIIVRSDRGLWRAAARSAEGRTLVALFPRGAYDGKGQVEAVCRGRRIVWEVEAGWPCLVALDRAGAVIGASGGGRLTVDGVEIARGDGPWMAASADGLPLNRSNRVVGAMVRDGVLTIPSVHARRAAQAAELRDGAPVPLARAPAAAMAPRQGTAMTANELYLIRPEPPVPSGR